VYNNNNNILAVNARLSPDDMKGLDLFFCVRVMSAVCARVLMSFLSLLSVPFSYIINLFVHIVTCLRMLNHTSVMVCVTELFFIQVNMLLGKHCCKVFYVIPRIRFTCNFIELYHHSTTIVVVHALYLQQSFLHVSVICSSSGKRTVQKWLLPKIITVYECIKTFHLHLM